MRHCWNRATSMEGFNGGSREISCYKTKLSLRFVTIVKSLGSARQNVDESFTVYFGRDKISPTGTVKVLGVTIDSHLTWVDQISSVVRRCYCVLVGVARMRQKLPKCTRRLPGETLVFPHLRYCLTIWSGCTASQKQRIQKVINFGVRIVVGLGRRDHVAPALRELEWCKVDEMIAERDIATMHHLINAPCAAELLRERVVLRSDVSCRHTRATEDGQLQLPKVRTESARRSFVFRATRTWNELPYDVRQQTRIRVLHQDDAC